MSGGKTEVPEKEKEPKESESPSFDERLKEISPSAVKKEQPQEKPPALIMPEIPKEVPKKAAEPVKAPKAETPAEEQPVLVENKPAPVESVETKSVISNEVATESPFNPDEAREKDFEKALEEVQKDEVKIKDLENRVGNVK